MPTSIHLPKPLLQAVDRRARRLKISRNRFIVRTLERELERETDWSPDFFERLASITPEEVAAIDDMARSIAQRRTRKGPPKL